MVAAEDTPGWVCKQAIVAAVKGLNLDGIGDNVISQIRPDGNNISYPAVLVCSMGLLPTEQSGTTEHKDSEFIYHIWIADRDWATQHEKEPKYQDWRHRIDLALDAIHLTDGKNPDPLPAYALTMPLPPLDEFLAQMPQYAHLVSGIQVRVVYREARP